MRGLDWGDDQNLIPQGEGINNKRALVFSERINEYLLLYREYARGASGTRYNYYIQAFRQSLV